MTGLGNILRTAVTLDAAYVRELSARQKLHLVAALRGTGNQRSRDHGPVSLEGEHAVHGQPEEIGPTLRLTAALLDYGGAKRVEALAGHGRHGENGSILKEGSLEKVAHVFLGKFPHVGVDHVYLGKRHDAVLHAEQRAYLKMFAGLRHDALVGGNDEQHEVYAGSPGHHGAHEFFMTRHVHDAHALSAGKIGIGESQLYGDAAALLFAETVAVYTCKRPDERRFSVVDMTCGSHDDGHDSS